MIPFSDLVSRTLSPEHVTVLEPFFYDNIAPIAILDHEFNFIRVNKAYAAADQREPSEFIGHNHFELYPSEENEEIFRQVIITKEPYRVQAKPFVYAQNPERGISHWDWSLSPVVGIDGEVSMLIVSLYDVSERVKVTEDLERFLRLSIDGLCTLDTNVRLLKVNDAFCGMVGYSRDELLGKSVMEIIHPEDYDRTLEAIQTHLNEGQPVMQHESRCRCKDGSHRWLQWSSVYDPERGRAYVVARDVTGKKELEWEMLRLDRMNLLAEMAAAIGHEVRNPMQTVRGFLQLLRGKEDRTHYVEYYDLMIAELDRANAILTEYLSLGRNRMTSAEVQSLNRIIETLVPLLQADAISESKVVVCELGEIPDLSLNDKEMRQLILNLVRNGLEAMPSAGQVTIRTYADGDRVILSVQDQGPGIPDDVLKNLGRPFYTTKKRGTGLGLATCYSIANRHQATITVDTSPEGTTLCVRFPV